MYKQQGVGLIEVMVTVLILSTALLALAGLQTKALQYNSSAYLRSQANIIAYDVMDRLRIGTDPASGASVPEVDVDALVSDLPGGEGSVECNADRVCTVEISWSDPGNKAGEEGAAQKTTFTYESRIQI